MSLVDYLRQAGFKGEGLKTAYGIAMRESHGNPQAFNPDRSTGDQSYGLFQINMLGGMGPSRRKQFGIQSNEALLDPVTNARAAYSMSKGGTDFGAWGIGPNAYRSGAGWATIAPYVKGFPGGGSETPTPGVAIPPAQAPASALDVSALLTPTSRRVGASLDIGDILFGKGHKAVDVPDLNLDFEFGRPSSVGRAPSAGSPSAADNGAGTPAGSISLPIAYKSTHPTDGLQDQGFTNAIDIMGSPGTPVLSPMVGTVLYFHPEGAQGGGSMEVKFADGRIGWIGHVDNGLPAGTKVGPGSQLAVISSHHAHPHVHWDLRA